MNRKEATTSGDFVGKIMSATGYSKEIKKKRPYQSNDMRKYYENNKGQITIRSPKHWMILKFLELELRHNEKQELSAYK